MAITNYGVWPASPGIMKAIIIVSICMKEVRLHYTESWYHFHFKGVCAGELLKKVVLRGRKDFGIRKGEEYLMHVQLLTIDEGTLLGTIIKCKKLDECWDRS